MNKNMIVKQMREACREHGIKGAVIGISGGKDSTVVAALMTEVLGAENVLGVMMPNGVQSDISDKFRWFESDDSLHFTVKMRTVNTNVCAKGFYTVIWIFDIFFHTVNGLLDKLFINI